MRYSERIPVRTYEYSSTIDKVGDCKPRVIVQYLYSTCIGDRYLQYEYVPVLQVSIATVRLLYVRLTTVVHCTVSPNPRIQVHLYIVLYIITVNQ